MIDGESSILILQAPEARKARFSARMRSVDYWPLAKNLHQMSGGKPESVTVSTSGW